MFEIVRRRSSAGQSACFTRRRSTVRARASPPKHYNPNPKLIGDGFGLVVYMKLIMVLRHNKELGVAINMTNPAEKIETSVSRENQILKEDLTVSKERLFWIDCAKGVLIIFVVIGHMIPHSLFVDYLYSFHVPAFFILSGYLLKCKNNSDFSKYQLIRYIIEYVSFSMASIGLRFAYDFLFEKQQMYENLITYSVEFVSGIGLPAIWFISSYLIARCVFALTGKMKVRAQVIINAGIVLATIIIKEYTSLLNAETDNFFVMMLISLIRGTFCSTFLFVGYRSKEAFDWICKKASWKRFVLSFCLLLLCWTLSSNNGQTNTSALNFGRNPLFCLICNFSGSFGMLFICQLLFNSKRFMPLEYYGRNSLIIMATHINFFCIDIAFLLFRKACVIISAPQMSLTFIKYPVCIIMVLLLEIPVVYIINKFFPFMIGKFRVKD